MKEKAGYLYKLAQEKDLNFKINLFGPNYTQTANNAMIEYFGQCLPDELPEKMQGSFGLVWDGTEIEGCYETQESILDIIIHINAVYF